MIPKYESKRVLVIGIASGAACFIVSCMTRHVADVCIPTGERAMSKSKDNKRETKKAPQKTPAEKKQAKRDKKNRTI